MFLQSGQQIIWRPGTLPSKARSTYIAPGIVLILTKDITKLLNWICCASEFDSSDKLFALKVLQKID